MDIHTRTHIFFSMSRSTKRCVFFYDLFCLYIRVCFQVAAFVRKHICHKVLLLGYPTRLELARVCSLMVFSWLWVYIEVNHFLRECLPLSALPLSCLWYLIRFVRCVYGGRMCFGVVSDFTYSYFCVCECVSWYFFSFLYVVVWFKIYW